MPKINPPFDRVASENELEELQVLYRDVRTHPLVSVALHPGESQTPGQISANTCRALGHVLERFPDWVRKLKPRFADTKDWTSAESALAEIRACGALLEAGFPVRLGQKSAATGARAEFHIRSDEIEVIVEVWTRNLGAKDVQRIETDLAETKGTRTVERGTITTSFGSFVPFGNPDPKKDGDSILTNVISRIAGIKEREHQAQDRCPFILWADLQSLNTLRFDFSHELQPLVSRNGSVSSGGYWHALYGRKGDVLLEIDAGMTRINAMLHDGRYQQVMEHGGATQVTAFVFSSPRTTVIMENPAPTCALPASFRNRLLGLPWFDINLSLANWSDGLVGRTVDVQRETIAAVVRTLGLSAGERAIRNAGYNGLISDIS